MDWIDQHRPEDVIRALEPILTAERKHRIDEVLAARLAGVTVALENLHDPHNGAAAIRSIEAMGLAELHVIEQAEPFRFSSTVTQGCEKWIAIHRHPEFGAAAAALRARGFALAAAVPGGPPEVDLSRPVALVFGNEHAGLSEAARTGCDTVFGIPMHGMTRSYNLSVSVALATQDCVRRLRESGRGGLDPAEVVRLKARFYALSLDGRAAEAMVERATRASRS